MKRLFALVCALFLLSVPGFAHPGGTDDKGGHYNRSTGKYHFHHGYSAHQHPDGVCPYDFKDKTDHSSGSSTSPKSTTLRNSAFDEFFYCNGHPRHRHEDGVCPWAEIDADPKPTYYISNEAFVAGTWVSKTPQPTTLPAASTKFKGDDRVSFLLYCALSIPVFVLIIIILAASLAEKTRQLKAEKAAHEASIHNMNVDCQRRLQEFKNSVSAEQIELFNRVRESLSLGMVEDGWLYDAITKPTEPDLSEGVVYISENFDSIRYHHLKNCTSNAILVSKVFAEKLGHKPCGCCDIAPQPEHDCTVTIPDHVKYVYHQKSGYCAGNTYYKQVPLSKAHSMGLRPCSRCNPPVENPKVWF